MDTDDKLKVVFYNVARAEVLDYAASQEIPHNGYFLTANSECPYFCQTFSTEAQLIFTDLGVDFTNPSFEEVSRQMQSACKAIADENEQYRNKNNFYGVIISLGQHGQNSEQTGQENERKISNLIPT